MLAHLKSGLNVLFICREVNLQLARLKRLQSHYDKKESNLFVNMLGKLRV